MRYLAILFAALFLVSCSGGGGKKDKKYKCNLTLGEWQFCYGKREPSVTTNEDGGFTFDFAGEPHYLTKAGQLQDGAIFDWEITGNGVLEPTECKEGQTRNPTWGLIIRRSDSVYGDQGDEYHRYWSSQRIPFNTGTSGRVVVDYNNLDGWSQVWGEKASVNPDEFEATINGMKSWGFTFGGCSHYGHGMNLVSGNATLTVKQVK